ncbi:hypothetical protein BC834DRAFT_897678 [Gloeopeniophorella convolvens]|nr:hypothetical protein BC834DRAFT_897678 [Gloeopeniophorella convolvens]
MHAKAINTTLRLMGFLTPSPVRVHDEDRYSLCEIWSWAVGVASDRDVHKVALHVLACLRPFYQLSHPQASTGASERLWGATYDQLFALEQPGFPPCAEMSHFRSPTSYLPSPASGHLERFVDQPHGTTFSESARITADEPSAPAPPSNSTIPVALITPETSETLIPGEVAMSSTVVDLALPVGSVLQSNHSGLPATVLASLESVLLPTSPVGTGSRTQQIPSPQRSPSPDVNGLSTGSGGAVAVDVEHCMHIFVPRVEMPHYPLRVPSRRVIWSPYDGWEILVS